jgi:hypothetical protein
MTPYLPVDPAFVKARGEYAYAKWYSMSEDEKEPLQTNMHRLMAINKMGEKSAVELLHALGLFLNVNHREEVTKPEN